MDSNLSNAATTVIDEWDGQRSMHRSRHFVGRVALIKDQALCTNRLSQPHSKLCEAVPKAAVLARTTDAPTVPTQVYQQARHVQPTQAE